jgi:hypothetical protein
VGREDLVEVEDVVEMEDIVEMEDMEHSFRDVERRLRR